jgi:hypothetical protein
MSDHLSADLSTDATRDFFRDQDPVLEQTIIGMESVESWTRDSYEPVQAALQRLAERLEAIDMHELPQDHHNKLIILLGYISSGKAIRLLMWIEEFAPNFVARTMAEAQMLAALDHVNEHAARLFIERIEVLERHHMLHRVFSPDRLRIITKVLRILNGQPTSEEDEDDEA